MPYTQTTPDFVESEARSDVAIHAARGLLRYARNDDGFEIGVFSKLRT
jgi:hypothetical protein